ncbi:MAG: carbon storage regulator [Lachnospiraceae bacterium]|nr:carbon storage regulator [Butyrivibrio sp.]MCM1410709.1 carbon storage regulator [Lachnospiraceae bacterium]
MLRLTVSTEEYLMIGEDIKLVFLGGTGKHLRIMVDAPRETNIVRSTVLERNITDPEERAKLPRYYAEAEHPEKYVKKDAGKARSSAEKAVSGKEDPRALKNPRIIITQGNVRSSSIR